MILLTYCPEGQAARLPMSPGAAHGTYPGDQLVFGGHRHMAPTTTRTASPAYARWVLALTAIASLMVMLDVMVVVTALHTIRLQLGASLDELEWTISAYTLSFAVLLMTAAALGDRFGWRRLFVLGLAVFTAAS